MNMNQAVISIVERGLMPDAVARMGIRRLLRKRLEHERRKHERSRDSLQSFIEKIRHEPIAVQTEKPREQHYELPAAFFSHVLGRRLKYSCNFWSGNISSLDKAEEAMLQIICERADVHDGMDILDLGCGWGALSLWTAQHYPECRIRAVSNSSSQREYIEQKCRENGLYNITVQTADMNTFYPEKRFDRILSLEMFEHMRNWKKLISRIAGWLKEEGKLFVHIFCHRQYPYVFENKGADNWMGQYFFTAGMMPSEQLLPSIQEDLALEKNWRVNGMHYKKTADAWLFNMDRRKDEVMPVLASVYGQDEAALWFQRWRIFFMACSELWGYDRGREWFVAHYLFHRGH